ncbi:unnamed protein product [Protopolystoma xenopodis]|uniref:Uncharacterized protein n=1 Tax=Protopolystoma xenopodis TaxID=117903 RepID=A0A448WEI4_9PLAT|nr:unnamed protein product [Protopolystoma xenopodis]
MVQDFLFGKSETPKAEKAELNCPESRSQRKRAKKVSQTLELSEILPTLENQRQFSFGGNECSFINSSVPITPKEIQDNTSILGYPDPSKNNLAVYLHYCLLGGGWILGLCTLVLFFGSTIISFGSDIYMARWTNLADQRYKILTDLIDSESIFDCSNSVPGRKNSSFQGSCSPEEKAAEFTSRVQALLAATRQVELLKAGRLPAELELELESPSGWRPEQEVVNQWMNVSSLQGLGFNDDKTRLGYLSLFLVFIIVITIVRTICFFYVSGYFKFA